VQLPDAKHVTKRLLVSFSTTKTTPHNFLKSHFFLILGFFFLSTNLGVSRVESRALKGHYLGEKGSEQLDLAKVEIGGAEIGGLLAMDELELSDVRVKDGEDVRGRAQRGEVFSEHAVVVGRRNKLRKLFQLFSLLHAQQQTHAQHAGSKTHQRVEVVHRKQLLHHLQKNKQNERK
jgi:hypothetical protein